jgi:hypothetical protein
VQKVCRGGELFQFSHVNNLSENIFPTKVNCDQSIEQSGVGGYMRGVGWSLHRERK